jgi:hypothetical protein
MSDPSKILTRQEKQITDEAKKRSSVTSEKGKAKGKDKEKSPDKALATVYQEGHTLLSQCGYHLELREGGDHCNHAILRPCAPQEFQGMEPYPKDFKPLQEIHTTEDLIKISSIFNADVCSQETRDFWAPLHNPKPGESDLMAFSLRGLKMKRIAERQSFSEPVRLGHTFDPTGTLTDGKLVENPRIWVPAREWFCPSVRAVQFKDVFTIFPKAERMLLMLLIGRIGVGKSNHIPEGWDKPVAHTARMAGVIVGKDPGLGKSTLFNGMIAAFTKCGFTVQTFRSTKERFGMKATALSDIAYKDDTSLQSLKEFLACEETKTIVTNGRFQVEDKFMTPEQINSRTVFLVNSNDWNSKFAYDLDPGIIDRIKLISTYREVEVEKLKHQMKGTVSDGSPDLRPNAHLPYLANKLGVSVDVLYLWCLRLATDYFWEVINDKSNPAVNPLQVEVRKWTTRLRIRFKADLTQSLINSMAFSWSLRTGNDEIPELNPVLLKDCMEHFYFLGVDPSAQPLVEKMKHRWEEVGRPSTHYYQGFREVRWESVRKALSLATDLTTKEVSKNTTYTFAEIMKSVIEKIDLRDGFKLGGTANYVIESWENMRHGKDELIEDGKELIKLLDERLEGRIKNLNHRCFDHWLDDIRYSPDSAETLRIKALNDVFKEEDRVKQ